MSSREVALSPSYVSLEGDALFMDENYEGPVAAYSDEIQYRRALVQDDQALFLHSPADYNELKRTLVRRSAAYVKLERPEEATEDADEALRLDSEYAPAHLRKGIAAFKLGNLAKAEQSSPAEPQPHSQEMAAKAKNKSGRNNGGDPRTAAARGTATTARTGHSHDGVPHAKAPGR
eukprot:COSAG05_NODE_3804_length_1830_cov_1.870595_2_plen_176_part_00